jgi:hypothetical protein
LTLNPPQSHWYGGCNRAHANDYATFLGVFVPKPF